MSVTLVSPPAAETDSVEQRFAIGGVRWDAYVAINDALDGHNGVRLVYHDGRLILMGKSRRHEWLSDCLGYFVIGIATHLGIPCEPAGEATYRRREKEAGLEGDRTFHFGANADRMRGGENYDFAADPPPDLAIEVEASHPADDAVETWGKMSVPEIWRFQAATNTCTFWKRRDDTRYEQIDQSMFLPTLTPDDVTESIGVARSSGTVPWLAGLPAWIDRVIRPRLERRDQDDVV